MPRKSELEVAIERLDLECDILHERNELNSRLTKGEGRTLIELARRTAREFYAAKERAARDDSQD